MDYIFDDNCKENFELYYCVTHFDSSLVSYYNHVLIILYAFLCLNTFFFIDIDTYFLKIGQH